MKQSYPTLGIALLLFLAFAYWFISNGERDSDPTLGDQTGVENHSEEFAPIVSDWEISPASREKRSGSAKSAPVQPEALLHPLEQETAIFTVSVFTEHFRNPLQGVDVQVFRNEIDWDFGEELFPPSGEGGWIW